MLDSEVKLRKGSIKQKQTGVFLTETTKYCTERGCGGAEAREDNDLPSSTWNEEEDSTRGRGRYGDGGGAVR